MAQKRINDVNAGVRRPYRLSDLQDLWDGLSETLALGTNLMPRIISGFDTKGDNTLSAGVVAFQNKLYFHPDTTGNRIPVGAKVYAREIASNDSRFFSDGTEQVFSFERVAGVTSSGGTLIGAFSIANLEAWRMGSLVDGSVMSTKLANNAVTQAKIASDAVTAGKLATGAVTTLKVANNAVTAVKLAPACAPCVQEGALNYPFTPSTGLWRTLPITDLLTYNATTGVWGCKMVVINRVDSEGTSLTLSGATIGNPTLHATLPAVVPVVVVGANDDEPVLLHAMGENADRLFHLTMPSDTVAVQPQGYAVVVMFMKTDIGYIPYAASAYNFR